MRVSSVIIASLLTFFISLHAAPKFPAVGEIDVGTSLNVRSSAGLDSKVLGRLKRGAKIVVLAEEGEFYKLQYPKQLEAWVASWLLLENGTKKKDKVARDKVNIRSGPSMQYPVIARLVKGYELDIKSINNSKWAQINPPSTASAYVSKKYVKLGKSYEVHLAEEQAKEESVKMFAKLRKKYESFLNKKTLSEKDFISMKTSLQKVANANPGTAKAHEALEMINNLQEFRYAVQLKETEELAAKQRREAEEKASARHREQIEKITTVNEKKLPKYQYEGWLDDVGGVWRRPATHKLKKGDKVLYYLKSGNEINLDEYVGKKVGINGTLKSLRFWGRMIIVDKIEVLYENPDTASKIWTKE